MGRYGNESLRADYNVEKVLEQYANNGLIGCKGRKLAASDLGIEKSKLDELLEEHSIKRSEMKRGKT